MEREKRVDSREEIKQTEIVVAYGDIIETVEICNQDNIPTESEETDKYSIYKRENSKNKKFLSDEDSLVISISDESNIGKALLGGKIGSIIHYSGNRETIDRNEPKDYFIQILKITK